MATASSYRPPRKSAVRWINGVGRALGAIGVPVARLDAEHLLRKASRSTGLDDFGDSAFREPLERYVRALEEEARLTPVGRLINQRELIRILENRLLMIEERKRHPEIGEERIEAPLFVLGLPRTGTTILHELLAQDPENRCPMTWEVMWPIPRPRAESFETDPRIARVDGYLKAVDSLIPGFRKMHPMGARLPQECVMLMNHDFMSMQFYCSNRVPSYEDWLEAQDHEPAYRAHRRYLQLLQSLAPAR